MKYIVNVEAVFRKNVVVDAESEDEAKKIVLEEFCNIDFDSNDNTERTIYSVREDEYNEAEEHRYQEI